MQRTFGAAISTIVLVAVLPIVVIIAVGITAIYLIDSQATTRMGNTNSVSTITTSLTIPCLLLNQSSTTTLSTTTENSKPDFGALFGNFSSMTVVLYGNDSGSSITTSSFSVLGRGSYTSSNGNATDYELNLTTIAIEPNATTTIASSGNVTNRESIIGYFAQNGSLISTVEVSGNQSVGIPLLFFSIFASGSALSRGNLLMINSTSVAIGSTKMNVTSYDLPASVETTVYKSCVSGGAATTPVTKLYDWTIQEGIVPGKDFSLGNAVSLHRFCCIEFYFFIRKHQLESNILYTRPRLNGNNIRTMITPCHENRIHSFSLLSFHFQTWTGLFTGHRSDATRRHPRGILSM